MENIALWMVMTFFVFVILGNATGVKKIFAFAIAALLTMPVNINGNVFTVLGSAKGKNVYSLFSIGQKADENAVALFGSLYQNAGKEAITGIGIAGYQNAGKEAEQRNGVFVCF